MTEAELLLFMLQVSFGAGETQVMTQLSEGHKTLEASTLICGVQHCKPTPLWPLMSQKTLGYT